MSSDPRPATPRPAAAGDAGVPVLDVAGLTLQLATPGGPREVLSDVSLRVGAGESVGLVGESGCGKSVTALAVMRLIPGARVATGRIALHGQDLLPLPERAMRALRGNQMAMIFQEPMTSLNPLLSVGSQIAEAVRLHRGGSRAEARRRAQALLERVGIAGAARRLDARPHEFSGGQRQRVMIAMALACEPRLLIADEPTTALDVTVQQQVLDLLDGLRRDLGMGLLLITHDLAVVSNYCDRVNVMYAGRVVESRASAGLFAAPAHPYTAALLATSPSRHVPGSALPTIEGMVPALDQRGAGCLYAPRCARALPRCRAEVPASLPVAGDAAQGRVACWSPVAAPELEATA